MGKGGSVRLVTRFLQLAEVNLSIPLKKKPARLAGLSARIGEWLRKSGSYLEDQSETAQDCLYMVLK